MYPNGNKSVCRKDIPYPIVSHESVPSLIDNLVTALYGTITKSVSNGRIVWNIACDPNNTTVIQNFPRNPGEGLLCYIIRFFNSIATLQNNYVTLTGTQTLTNKTLTLPTIAGAVFSGSFDLSTNSAQINGGTFNNISIVGGTSNNRTLTNATLTSPTISSASFSGSNTLATGTTFSGGTYSSPTIGTATFTGSTSFPNLTIDTSGGISTSGVLASSGGLNISAGTVALPIGSITGTMIANGTITDTDISSSAAIANSKLAGAPTTANTASTIVLRDSSGNIAAGNAIVGVTDGSTAGSTLAGYWTSNSTASGSAVNLTTATVATITSLASLPAGDWDIRGMGAINLAGSSLNYARIAISTTGTSSITIPTNSLDGSNSLISTSNASNQTTTLGTSDLFLATKTMRVSLSSATTIYLVAYCTFSNGTVKAYGNIEARRVR